MNPYVPSGRTDPDAFTRVMLVAGLGGLVIGVVAHLIGAQARPVVVLALFGGAAAGLVARLAVAHWRVRAPRAGAACGLTAALAVPLVDAVASYMIDRDALAAALAGTAVHMSGDRSSDRDRAVDRAIVLGVAARRLREDAALAAALLRGERVCLEGGRELAAGAEPGAGSVLAAWVADRRVALLWPRGGVTPATGLGAWLHWLAELVFAGAAGAAVAYLGGRAPFCERCNDWLPTRGDRVELGGEDRLAEVRRALAHDDAASLARLAASATATDPVLMLRARACPRCPDPLWFVELEHHLRGAREVAVAVIDQGFVTRDVLVPCFAAATRKTRG